MEGALGECRADGFLASRKLFLLSKGGLGKQGHVRGTGLSQGPPLVQLSSCLYPHVLASARAAKTSSSISLSVLPKRA